MRTLRAVATAFVVAAGLLPLPLAAPSPADGHGPLPECRIDDILTVPRGYDGWRITLVDWILTVGPDYKPTDLVSVREGGVAGGGLVREVAIDDLRAMARAAEDHGTPLVAWSPYRGYKQQRKLFNGYASGYGFDEAINFSARPGHSEHQLGVTIDFVAVGDIGLTSNWEVTPTGGWMAKNAWKYGWLMSYPKGKQAVTCYSYEPWHYRYVGRELAREIRDSGLTIREYLWEHHTRVDPTTGEPIQTAPAAPSASVLPSATLEASPTAPAATASTATSPSAALVTPSIEPGAQTPAPVGSPSQPAIDPPVVMAGFLLVLASLGLIASVGRWRGSRRG